jgi:hypothetical protein
MATLTRTFTRTRNEIRYADPYKKCRQCGNWIDGALDAPGPLILVPCEHQSDYRDICPSWGPVDGCSCAEYSAHNPETPISHEMRPPKGDGKVY